MMFDGLFCVVDVSICMFLLSTSEYLDPRIYSRKTIISPENQWLEGVFPNGNSPFLGDMLVFRSVR